MGQAVSAIRKELTAADKEHKVEMEQRLQILEKMVEGRLQHEQTEILAGERNDQQIHAGTIVEMQRQVNITMNDGGGQSIKEGIGAFFKFDLIGGLEKIIETAADAVLGNASMGEYESSTMFIVWSSNALLRCDAYYYRWNFASKGVIESCEGVVGVLLVKRVIDMTKTDPQVLTWAISEQAAAHGLSREDTDKMIDSAMEVLEKVSSFQVKLRQIEAAAHVGVDN